VRAVDRVRRAVCWSRDRRRSVRRRQHGWRGTVGRPHQVRQRCEVKRCLGRLFVTIGHWRNGQVDDVPNVCDRQEDVESDAAFLAAAVRHVSKFRVVDGSFERLPCRQARPASRSPMKQLTVNAPAKANGPWRRTPFFFRRRACRHRLRYSMSTVLPTCGLNGASTTGTQVSGEQ
jgi:hypothetical protein